MKTKFIWIIVQMILIAIALIYGFLQQTRANDARQQAELNAQEALTQKALADVNAAEAHKTEMELRSQLEACQKIGK